MKQTPTYQSKSIVRKLVTKIYHQMPMLQGTMKKIDSIVTKPKDPLFLNEALPYENDEIFIKAAKDIHKFDFDCKSLGVTPNTIDDYKIRNWYVCYCIRHAMFHCKSRVFVECGVGLGWTAFFALRVISDKTDSYSFHLFDAWDAMIPENLTKSELFNVGQYADLDINRTKNNLSEFKNVIFHKGMIPGILEKEPITEKICYLHIDLNSSKPTRYTLDKLIPLVEQNGVILFDDYGHLDYHDTKTMIDEYFKDYPILKLSTGQAIIFNIPMNFYKKEVIS